MNKVKTKMLKSVKMLEKKIKGRSHEDLMVIIRRELKWQVK